MSKYSRVKGQNGQRDVARLLRAEGYEARSGYQSIGAVEPDVVTDYPFYPEVKLCNKLSIYRAIEQVSRDNKTEKPYIVFFRKDHGEWHVALKWEDFKNLPKTIYENRS